MNLLFWGALPPDTIDGISISNRINLDILKEVMKVDIIEESNTFIDHDRISFLKLKIFLKSIISIVVHAVKNKYTHFYLVFSLSTVGSLKTLIAIILFRMFNRGKIVLHIHRGDFFSRFYIKRINRIIARMIFPLTSIVLVLSGSQKKEYLEKFRAKFIVLPNTIEREGIFTQREKTGTNFIFISNYLIDKGILDLLTVFTTLAALYPSLKLSTYGSYSSRRLMETIKGFESDNIKINDLITGDSKMEQLAIADCLVLSSWNEGQPLILLESMAVGTPVIATRVGLIPEILGDDYPYLSTPGDLISLENAITGFLKAKNNYDVSLKLRKKYESDYSNEIHRENLLNIFRET